MSLLIKRRTVAFDDLKDTLKTGDIVLMHGQYVSSHIVEFLEGSNWSHSAIVVRAEDLGIKCDDPVLLWESNIITPVDKGETPIYDVLLGKEKRGPQLVSLHQRMKVNFHHKDDSSFAIRHLHTDRTPEMFKVIRSVIDKYHSADFPATKEELLCPLEGRWLNEPDKTLNTIFCSELVAITYMALGLLSQLHPFNSYVPADFSFENSVGLLNRAWLGNEILIEPKSL